LAENRARRGSSLEARGRGRSVEPQTGSHAWLSKQLFETELVLRNSISNEEDLQYTLGAAEAGLMYMEQIASCAKEVGISKGALSRYVMPFDDQTSIAEQARGEREVGRGWLGEDISDKISSKKINYLVKGANSMRKLVRVKVADDNDLETAELALKTTKSFIEGCLEEGKKRGVEGRVYETVYCCLRDGKEEDELNSLFPRMED